MLRQSLLRLRLPPDTRERHAVAARLLAGAATVLDVGGTQGTLAAFAPGRVTTANPEPPADVVLEDTALPFPDGSFDAVTSLDVLEHLAREERAPHVAELARVARRLVVLSTPLGAPAHVESERVLAQWHVGVTGRRHRFLEEHLARGLLDADELRELAEQAGLSANVLFHGDYRVVADAFRTGVLARTRRRPRDLARYALLRFRRVDSVLEQAPRSHSNRMFLVGSPAEPSTRRRPSV